MTRQRTEPARLPAAYVLLFPAGLFFAAHQADTLLDGVGEGNSIPGWLPGALSQAFLLAGILILAWFVKGVLVALAERRRSREYPDEPWRWRRDWQGSRFSNNTLRKLGANFAFLLTALIVAGSAAYFVMTSREQSGLVELAVVVAASAFTVFLAWQAVKALRVWRRWGSMYLQLQSSPAFLGSTMHGSFDLPPGPAADKMRCQLVCYRATKSTGGSGDSRITETTVWESDEESPAISADGHTASFHFEPPKGRPSSDWADPNERVKWFVKLKTVSDGEFRYEVPVFNRPY
jgi:hypothetical protein